MTTAYAPARPGARPVTSDAFVLPNGVRIGIAQTLLLLYRYLTDIYTLGNLSFVQFLAGTLRGRGRSLDGARVLCVSGNGIGELERQMALQWRLDTLEVMSVTPEQMRIMRLLTTASAEDIAGLFRWAQDRLSAYPNLRGLVESPGLVDYWTQQCESWKHDRLHDAVRMFGGSPWSVPDGAKYDAILLSHAQSLLRDREAKELTARLAPGGWLGAIMPVSFRPEGMEVASTARFADSPVVRDAKARMQRDARRQKYELPSTDPAHIRWGAVNGDITHVVSFALASPLTSVLIGELLIYSLSATLPDSTRLALLESALAETPPGAGAGTEAMLIMLSQAGTEQ